MKVLVSVIAANDSVAPIVIPTVEGVIINPTELKMDSDSDVSETADYSNQAIEWFKTQPSPAFHDELEAWWTIKLGEEDTYGMVHGVMTSSGNIIISGHCDTDDELTTVFLGYYGTRGKFLEIQSVAGVRITEFFGEEVDVYETTGPSDMLWYEDMSTYTIRTKKCGEVLKAWLRDISKQSEISTADPFIMNAGSGLWNIDARLFNGETQNAMVCIKHWVFNDPDMIVTRMNAVREAVCLIRMSVNAIENIA